MRRFILILCGCLVLAAVVGLGGFVWSRFGRRDQRLADGSYIRLEKVSFGKEEHIELGGLVEKLKAKLPPSWQAKLPGSTPSRGMSSWYQNTVTHTNEDALYIYISRRTLGKGYRSVDARFAQLVDEDGCTYAPTQNGGYDGLRLTPSGTPGPMGYSVGWFRFEAFPRREKKFRLLVYDSPGTPYSGAFSEDHVEFMVSNPAPPPRIANWPVEPLPVTRSQDRVAFILTQVTIKTNADRYYISRQKTKAFDATYQFKEDGQPSTNWEALDTELYDSSGNFVSRAFPAQSSLLCPREAAWKLRVKFFGTEGSRAASNAVWTLRGIAVPAPGKFTLLDRSQELQGLTVKAVTFGGAGEFTYSNNIALEASPPEDPPRPNSSRVISWPNNWNGRYSKPQPTYELHVKSPHLALEVGEMNDDQRLTVRAMDDQGREFYASKVGWGPSDSPAGVNYLHNWYPSEGTFLAFDLPADAKTVDLTFCIHTCRTAEFIFKPPFNGAPPAK
jgi:hypothetical protein